MKKIEDLFYKWAVNVSKTVGSPYWLFFSITLVLIWFPSGFIIGFNDSWHLLINTTTTILTFIMMSLLHASQSRWEEKIERMETDQARILKILEKETERLITDIEPKSKNDTNSFPDNESTSIIDHKI
ncbi:hypothetical protein A3B64_03685 [candidate division WWE3 bacterium RIFCSPLOWO2_01_FULL_37_24]|nr:MAG: hypothetical protein A3B64_03685 [candidate division WWE3 bacterium RIFCSPLOWO2_01_FULL_37_24]